MTSSDHDENKKPCLTCGDFILDSESRVYCPRCVPSDFPLIANYSLEDNDSRIETYRQIAAYVKERGLDPICESALKLKMAWNIGGGLLLLILAAAGFTLRSLPILLALAAGFVVVVIVGTIVTQRFSNAALNYVIRDSGFDGAPIFEPRSILSSLFLATLGLTLFLVQIALILVFAFFVHSLTKPLGLPLSRGMVSGAIGYVLGGFIMKYTGGYGIICLNLGSTLEPTWSAPRIFYSGIKLFWNHRPLIGHGIEVTKKGRKHLGDDIELSSQEFSLTREIFYFTTYLQARHKYGDLPDWLEAKSTSYPISQSASDSHAQNILQ